MRRSLRLRPWQHDALQQLERTDRRDFLAVATPGAGKTTFALTAAARDLTDHPHRRVVVVAPTAHLKVQWAAAAAGVGLHLEPDWASAEPWPRDMHGVVVTYQQVAADPRPLRSATQDAFVILDELHHAGAEKAWGDAVASAFADAARRLSLSGTPFRSDSNPIPFVEYAFDEAVADYVYGYGEALKDGGIVRPVFFPRVDGEMEWSAPDGSILSATFDDHLDRTLSAQRLRTALSLDGQWLPDVLGRADATLAQVRERHPDAGGLVIAMDQDHARGIARLLEERHGRRVTVAVSDDPTASARIAAFREADEEWIVAVRMVSEGVDIPRLRVGVWATTTVTELFFRQAVGRLVRWTPGLRRQKAFLYLPDDPRLRALSAGIAEARTHSLRRREEDGDQEPVELDELPAELKEDQLSLFAAISSTALQEREPTILDDDHPEDLIHDTPVDAFGLEVELAPPPPPAARGLPEGELPGVPRGQRKRELRRANADRVTLLVHLTGLDARTVNQELNAKARLRSIDEATLAQLERRLEQADDWLARA